MVLVLLTVEVVAALAYSELGQEEWVCCITMCLAALDVMQDTQLSKVKVCTMGLVAVAYALAMDSLCMHCLSKDIDCCQMGI